MSEMIYSCLMGAITAYRIGAFCDRSVAAARERLSGMLSYASHHPEISLDIFTPESEQRLLRSRLDGAIGYLTPRIQRLLSRRMPIVQLENPSLSSVTSLSIDNDAIARLAFTYFHTRGFINFAYIASDKPKEMIRSRERESAFLSAARENGFACPAYRFGRQHGARQSTSEIPPLAEWLSSLPKPCAVMAYADDIARIAIDACNYARLAVPEQVQIIGVDNDIDICENTQPSITSIWPDFYEAGRRGIELLHKIILGARPQKAISRSYGVRMLIERASTVDLRGGGRVVSLANNYLRQNFRSRLNISDLAKSLNVSRRLLDIRYREIMGRTIHEEWSRLRLEEAKRLLSGGMPVDSVFSRCGFSTIVAFRKAFKSHFGVNPSEMKD